MEEFDEIFHIVSIKDDKAKILAMELANDKGRKVLDAIFENKKSSSDLAKELNLGLPTILFHIERLKETGLIEVIDTELSKKFREIKYYGISKKAILILPSSKKDILNRSADYFGTRIPNKIIGLTALLGAGITGIFIKIFSKDFNYYNALEKTLAPAGQEGALDAAKAQEIGATVQSIPSLMEIVGIIALGAVLSVVIVAGYTSLAKRRAQKKINEEEN